MNRNKFWTAVLAAGWALGCASTSVQSDRDTRVDLASYKTFEVQRGQVIANGILDQRDTLVHDRVASAMQQELQQKGLQPTSQSPDLIATYTAGGNNVVEVHDAWDDNAYLGPDGYAWGGTWVDEYPQGRLVLDLIDAKTKKLVWRSIVEVQDNNLRSEKTITKAVDKGLEKYPGLGTY
jgi:hypothetical protein